MWSKLYTNISSATIKFAKILMYPCVISPLYLLKNKLQTYRNQTFENLKHSQKHSHWGYATNLNLKCLFQSNVNNSNSVFHSFSQSTTTEPDPLSALLTQQQDESFDHPKFREKQNGDHLLAYQTWKPWPQPMR